MAFGQMIGIALSVVLPLRFLLQQPGALNLGSKLNFLLNIIFAYASILSLFMYLYYLVTKRKRTHR